jgi:hypothetical protein
MFGKRIIFAVVITALLLSSAKAHAGHVPVAIHETGTIDIYGPNNQNSVTMGLSGTGTSAHYGSYSVAADIQSDNYYGSGLAWWHWEHVMRNHNGDRIATWHMVMVIDPTSLIGAGFGEISYWVGSGANQTMVVDGDMNTSITLHWHYDFQAARPFFTYELFGSGWINQ